MTDELTVPIEQHTVVGRTVHVYRADLAVPKDRPPYVKMAVLPQWLDVLKARGVKIAAYYANSQSYWCGGFSSMAKAAGIEPRVYHPQLKQMPEWTQQLNGSLRLLRPNIYSVNYAIAKRATLAEGGFMIPMGIDDDDFIKLQCQFFQQNKSWSFFDRLIVPVGSGTALSSLLFAGASPSKVMGVATRPAASVARLVATHCGKTDGLKIFGDMSVPAPIMDAPWPVHKPWERKAFAWLRDNIANIPHSESICFMHLGT